eukprot:scaffold9503_cov27-Tisochrysis_lutea.AAC.2
MTASDKEMIGMVDASEDWTTRSFESSEAREFGGRRLSLAADEPPNGALPCGKKMNSEVSIAISRNSTEGKKA